MRRTLFAVLALCACETFAPTPLPDDMLHDSRQEISALADEDGRHDGDGIPDELE